MRILLDTDIGSDVDDALALGLILASPELELDNAAFLHNPLTVLALYDVSLFGFEALPVVTMVEQGVLRTLEVGPSLGIGAPMRVATSVDAAAAERAIADRLLGGRRN